MSPKPPTLDLSGVPCPINAARALLRLEGMDPGAELRVIVDDGEPIANLPAAVEEQGHHVRSKAKEGASWCVLIQRSAA